MKLFLVATILGFSAGVMHAEEVKFSSGPQRTSLLELYTSEGCSSCPPAETQLSRLKESARLWKELVPVAFHVDYWDRLGWRDRFSSSAWTARQSRYAALWQSESVYTPAFVLNGRECRSGIATLPSPNEQEAGRLTARSDDGRNWSINYQPAAAGGGEWEAHLALLGAGISLHIGAGENGGRDLEHDFVVLHLENARLQAGAARLTIPESREKVPRQAIAVWVTRAGEIAPVQATGGWLAAH